MVDKWTAIIENEKSGNSAVIDVNMWFGKATLDACVLVWRYAWMGRRLTAKLSLNRIGAGAFDYDFGALDDADNPLTKSSLNIMYDHPPPLSTINGCYRIDRLPCSPALRRSGTPRDSSFSSWLSRNGAQD